MLYRSDIYNLGENSKLEYENYGINLIVATLNFEDFYILGYNAMQPVENQTTFRRNISPASSGSKNKPSKKPA
jgi:hypothetical protein